MQKARLSLLRLGLLVSVGALLAAAQNQAPETPRDQKYPLFHKKEGPSSARTRSVAGRVLDAAGKAVKGAQVQLKDLDRGETRAVSTAADGAYRFDDLSRTQDYELQASLRDAQSRVRTISQYSSEQTVQVTLTLETVKK